VTGFSAVRDDVTRRGQKPSNTRFVRVELVELTLGLPAADV
jgi:hypothetical protein